MVLVLLLAFILVPIAELAVIGEIAAWLGIGPTIVILLVDSLAGAVLVRREGRRAWDAFRRALAEARWPGDEVAQGAMVLVGGALLLTPGFITDVVGLLLVVPPTRALASKILRRRLTPGTGSSGRGDDRGQDVLEVEVLSVERDEPPSAQSSSAAEPSRRHDTRRDR